jgi:hypothetical protein
MKLQGFVPGDVHFFPAEGTKEVYIGEEASAPRLLLVEAVEPGPYQRALNKRGPGIHHLGIQVPSLSEFLSAHSYKTPDSLCWQIHSGFNSELNPEQTVFLFRRGVPFLLEVHQCSSMQKTPSEFTIKELIIKCDTRFHSFVVSLGIPELTLSINSKDNIRMGQKIFQVSALCESTRS